MLESKKSHWDKPDKEYYHLKLYMPFIRLVPVRLLLSSMVVLPCEWLAANGLSEKSVAF